ncbi:MAG TPA: hypothetical protein VHX38_05070 [Pseudonocardiaceae bacterium]|nr:hypothetical protein [Pseudonocardiaceae bacterium]
MSEMASQSWVGGDIAGLTTMGTTLSPAPADVKAVVGALSAKVDSVVNDAGWQGDAADSFRKKWSADAITAGGLADVTGQVGSIISDLAAKLQQVENALHDAAGEAAKQGVPIGANGTVPPTELGSAALAAAKTYAQEYTAALQMAQGYRLNAASSLSDLYGQVGPDSGDSESKPDQWVTIGDYLRGLYTVPNESNRRILKKISDTDIQNAENTMKQARKDLKAAKAVYQAKGLKLPSSSDASVAHSKSLTELDDLKTSLASAQAGDGELPLNKFLNTKLGDIATEIPVLSRFSKLSGLVDAIKDIPVVDIAASGVAAAFQYKDDQDKGWSSAHAAGADFGAAAIGIGAGVGATALLASAPAWGTVTGAGIAVVGVGDIAYQAFQENWSEDDAQHGGFWGGTLAGTGHVFTNVGKDVAHMGEDVYDGVKSLWNDVF